MKNNSADNLSEFIIKLRKLCLVHGIYPAGNVRLYLGESWDKRSFSIEKADELNYSYAVDKSGPFLTCSIQKIPEKIETNFRPSRIVIADKDHLLRDGIKSMVDGKYYGNRRDYNDHLKRHDMIEVGDQAKVETSKDIKGDHDCRKELSEAFKQHLG